MAEELERGKSVVARISMVGKVERWCMLRRVRKLVDQRGGRWYGMVGESVARFVRLNLGVVDWEGEGGVPAVVLAAAEAGDGAVAAGVASTENDTPVARPD